MSELLPCPFCGCAATVDDIWEDDNNRAPRPHRVNVVECEACDLRMRETSDTWWSGSLPPPETDEDDAAKAAVISRWNGRAGKVAYAVLDMSGESFHSIHETEAEAQQAAMFLGKPVEVRYI